MPLVLVLDEDKDCRESVAGYLRHLGFRTITADSGETAMKAVIRETPSVVILDVMMLPQDGARVVEEIKSHMSHHRLPIVVLSGHQDTPLARRVREKDAETVIIESSCSLQEIAEKIKEELRTRVH
jgi:response regulator RpfG family c-di-GMP phosphodiesterase